MSFSNRRLSFDKILCPSPVHIKCVGSLMDAFVIGPIFPFLRRADSSLTLKIFRKPKFSHQVILQDVGWLVFYIFLKKWESFAAIF